MLDGSAVRPQLFDWMKTNDKISAPTYTSFFSVLGKAGRAEKALRVFNELPADDAVRSNVYVCNSILSTLVYNGKVDKAFRLFELLKQEGLKPDIITYSTVSFRYTSMSPKFDWVVTLAVVA